MKKIFYPMAAVVILLASAFVVVTSQDWTIKEGYAVKFSTKEAEGVFKTLTGTIRFDENDLRSSSFDVTIDAKSINSGNGMKNKHAMTEKYLDAKRTPDIKFTSNDIVKASSGYEAKGTLEMRGVKKPLTIPFTFQKNGADGVFNGTFTIKRTDFMVGGQGGPVGDEIKIDVTVPVSPK